MEGSGSALPGTKRVFQVERPAVSGLSVLVLLLALHSLAAAELPDRVNLRHGWAVQSSSRTTQGGEILSTAGFKPSGWYEATVPSTVLAVQVAAGEFKEPYFGDNLRKIPGMTYPIGENFANLPMSKDSPYAPSWWYRTEFRLPEAYRGRVVWLHFDGINNRANIWLNGRKLADSRDVAGAYRIYEFNATDFVLQDETNVLAVETFAPTENDFGINFVDWNPTGPDKNMGVWRDVYLSASGPVSVRHAQVVTHFPGDPEKQADLTVMADLRNASDKAIDGILEGKFEDTEFRQSVKLAPGEVRSVRFTAADYPQLHVREPKLWWPAPVGPQNLHLLTMRFLVADAVSDVDQIHFGIREITAALNGPARRPGKMFHLGSGKVFDTDTRPLLFRVNQKTILIRGAGWAPDLLLRNSQERLRTELQYVRDMNLNAIRLEGKLESDEFFDLADQMGILVMAGWCCCDHWEDWDHWGPADLPIATESLRTQILRLRSHPSLLVWLNGSDWPPPANVEKAYIKVLHETDWPNPYVSSASAKPTSVTGASGVKMTGPYEYVPPGYWLTDTNRYGGAFGFNTETSPGQAIPLKSSLEQIFPADHLWPTDGLWNFHAGAGDQNATLQHYNQAMTAIYGGPTGLDDYVTKSQAMAYDGERAMFEAYARNKYNSTGVIQWMLNNGWPSVIWHLYDYFLQPAGGYFGAKKACEPIHVQYSYDDRGIVVVNNFYHDETGLTVTAALYDSQLHEKFSRKTEFDAPADSAKRVFVLPEISPTPEVSFVKLTLQDKDGRVLSSNFYWLPSKPSSYDWNGTPKHAFYTSVSTYEDLTMLNHLPRVRLEASATRENNPGGDAVRVRLHNSTRDLAFQIRLGIHEEQPQSEVLPVFWEDNYFSLMPGETRVVTAQYGDSHKLGANPQLEVNGWNIDPLTVHVGSDETTARNPR